MYLLYGNNTYLLLALLICMGFAWYADSKVKSAYRMFGAIPNRRGITGRDAASRLLHENNLYQIAIGHVRGTLTDYYDPKNEDVNLSDGVYNGSSIASVAIAAHEIGHVMQKHTGYSLYRTRVALVPLVNLGSRLAFPLVIVGFLLDILLYTVAGSVGYWLALVGVALYASTLLFALVTLPVELDASRRAKKMLAGQGILTEEEMHGASKVLSAAAMTYLASLLISLVYFLRFLFYVMTLFGRRRD